MNNSWDFDDRGETYRVLSTDKKVLIGEAFSDTTATCVISANGYSDLKLTLNKSKHTATIAVDETEKTYKVTAATAENGTVSVDKTTAKEGETVTISTNPANGYVLKSLSAADSNGKAITVTNSTFQMPASDVTVSASF